MDDFGFTLELDVQGRQGPARSEEEAAADQAAGLAAVEAKHAQLADLQAGFEADGHPPERARVLAAQAYQMREPIANREGPSTEGDLE